MPLEASRAAQPVPSQQGPRLHSIMSSYKIAVVNRTTLTVTEWLNDSRCK
jgi:hypothetical protein